MYKIRIILDTPKDVFRTISIDENCNLEQMHYAISNAFGFDGKELASFYRTDNEWNQGEEIPLFPVSDDINESIMSACILKNELTKKHNKLIYVYDFMNMWSFYVELIDASKESVSEAKVILSVGNVPESAPEKEFKSDFDLDNFNDGFDDEFGGFENIDDIDFDNY